MKNYKSYDPNDEKVKSQTTPGNDAHSPPRNAPATHGKKISLVTS